MKTNYRAKLTLKTAKILATQELGISTGLAPSENNNDDCQWYEIRFGNRTLLTVSNDCACPGVAYVAFDGKRVYYDTTTLQERYDLTESERKKVHHELLREEASCNGRDLFKALLEVYGLETCRNMLDKAAKDAK